MIRRSFTAASVREFLKSGWMLSLDSKQILVGWGELRAASAAVDQPGTATLFAPDFYLNSDAPWQISAHWDLLDRETLANLVAGAGANVNAQDQRFQWVEPSEALFGERFATIKSNMQQEGLKKAVPVVFAEADGELNDERKLGILQRLFTLPATLHLYGVWREGSAAGGEPFGGMIGATPELLFLKNHERVETFALAGTKAKVEGSGGELLNDPKEREEHQIVIDDLMEVFSRVGEVERDVTEVLELPTLYHLKTAIRARPTAELGFAALAKLLHPTPALGVAPRARGFEEMRRWDEPSVRWRFGAPFGVTARLEDGREVGKCVVAIRNIQWQDRLLRLGSGCGIVPASDAGREWRELQAKRDSVRRMLGV